MYYGRDDLFGLESALSGLGQPIVTAYGAEPEPDVSETYRGPLYIGPRVTYAQRQVGPTYVTSYGGKPGPLPVATVLPPKPQPKPKPPDYYELRNQLEEERRQIEENKRIELMRKLSKTNAEAVEEFRRRAREIKQEAQEQSDVQTELGIQRAAQRIRADSAPQQSGKAASFFADIAKAAAVAFVRSRSEEEKAQIAAGLQRDFGVTLTPDQAVAVVEGGITGGAQGAAGEVGKFKLQEAWGAFENVVDVDIMSGLDTARSWGTEFLDALKSRGRAVSSAAKEAVSTGKDMLVTGAKEALAVNIKKQTDQGGAELVRRATGVDWSQPMSPQKLYDSLAQLDALIKNVGWSNAVRLAEKGALAEGRTQQEADIARLGMSAAWEELRAASTARAGIWEARRALSALGSRAAGSEAAPYEREMQAAAERVRWHLARAQINAAGVMFDKASEIAKKQIQAAFQPEAQWEAGRTGFEAEKRAIEAAPRLPAAQVGVPAVTPEYRGMPLTLPWSAEEDARRYAEIIAEQRMPGFVPPRGSLAPTGALQREQVALEAAMRRMPSVLPYDVVSVPAPPPMDVTVAEAIEPAQLLPSLPVRKLDAPRTYPAGTVFTHPIPVDVYEAAKRRQGNKPFQ